MKNPREQVNDITTRSGVQLPEIHVKRIERNNEQLMIKEEETRQEETRQQHEKSKEEVSKESAESSKVRVPIPIKAYVPQFHFLRDCRSINSTSSLKNFLKFSRNCTSTFLLQTH
ncbi:Uncharacterized protein Adt_42278 [Abeliophyllum distichum]|uniref:Uncharacterized protein n=1 Tax=Abeliophyllum distichum TaxID=126358 RepID=A0ABD1PR86_9LAMI